MYPNIGKGAAALFKAEMLSLIASIAIVVVTLMSVSTLIASVADGSKSGAVGSVAIAGAAGIVCAVMGIISLILQIMGFVRCAKDDSRFKIVLWIALILLALSVILAITSVSFSKTGWYKLLDVISGVGSFLNGVLVLQYLIDALEKAKCQETAAFGNLIIKAFIIVILVKLIFSGAGQFNFMAAIVISMGSVICSLVFYVLYVVFLKMAAMMLENK